MNSLSILWFDMTEMARMTVLPGGERVPSLGIGTWMMAERARNRADEIAALQTAIDLGMTVVDTAEMYASGDAEKLVGEALGARRKEVFLISKVMPQNASRRNTVAACEASLRRLKTGWLDMYLLHWRGSLPLEGTIEAFDELERAGKIRYWGVSNFDVGDMKDIVALEGRTQSSVASNQVLYNLMRRGIEHDLLDWCRTRAIPVMAYSPFEQGRLLRDRRLTTVARRLHATPAQVALAWVLRGDGVLTIPKAASAARVSENHGALEITFTAEDLAELDEAFPSPTSKTPLEMI